MRVIVAGSRTWSDYALLAKELDRLTNKLDRKKLVILSGGADGADKLGEKWCFERMVSYQRFPADWHKYGKRAGHIRNSEMLEEGKADALIAFWNGSSPGTADIIRKARKKGIKVRVIRPKRKWWEK